MATAGAIVVLPHRPPLDFAAMLAFFARRAIPGIERIGPDRYERACGPAQASTWIRVTAAEDRPELQFALSGPAPADPAELAQRVRRLFGEDTLLADAIARRPGLRVPGSWDGFELAVRAVRALTNADAFPAGDLVLQQVLGDGQRLSERATEARSQPWRPWRAYAALLLWHLAGDRAQAAKEGVDVVR